MTPTDSTFFDLVGAAFVTADLGRLLTMPPTDSSFPGLVGAAFIAASFGSS
eukprot:CAMPEP_0202019100 /NCGR_PEP_ID=MMETSP0905-20130828/41123_1 /ASSEMBLY_ACC=CAM_ASM_000554 /TAXON_ID=420261 /ORGANISM="Thalassiosira antarctica, Strain CCMP982" /LENGTH=50 /DNA_ID=CAMNT_0048580255 /DNA_START=11 /DNA_END=159 /DNA_ORIENTATION=-